jgi:hypothetical protein
MSKSTYPLKLPASVKKAAAELAASDGVSLNQFIAAAVAEKLDACAPPESSCASARDGKAKKYAQVPSTRSEGSAVCRGSAVKAFSGHKRRRRAMRHPGASQSYA